MSQVEDDPKKPDAEGGAEAETDDDILEEARERYTSCTTNESDNRTAALDDLLFLAGGTNQWDEEAVRIRKAEKRPMITVNNLPTFLHQITNDLRLNKLGGSVSPVDSMADVETADVVQGMVRHIEYDSNASVATVTATSSAAAIGFGWFRLVTEYESPTSFDQKIMFKRVRNALSVHKDPLSQELDGSDSKFYFIDSLEDRAEFKRQYPDANANSTDLIGQQVYHGWFTENTVLVCEYYRIKETEDVLCELVDGSKGFKSELPKERHGEIAVGADGKPRERKTFRRVVEWFKITASDILERTVIKCQWIPVFPVYGDEIDIEGKVIRKGIIRDAKGPFSMYNYFITSATEEVGLRAKSPFIAAAGQTEAYPEWQTANTRSYAVLPYDPVTVDDKLAPPPQRQPMADVPAGMLAMAMHAADNKKAVTGLFDSSLGARGSATSGKQELAQQRQGDTANFHFTDNLKITYKHALRCIVDMIPHYYDAARAVRMLGEDEKSKVVQVNQPFERKNPKTGAIETVMHDLTVGEYDITVKAGPGYDTQRQEAADFLTDAIQGAKDPATSNVLTYLAIKNRDVPGAEEATKMIKKLLPQGLAEPEEGEEQEPTVPTPHGPMPLSQVGPFIQEMGQALQNAAGQVEKADVQEKENQARELEIKNKDADTKKYEAETKRITADADLLRANAEAAAAGQNVVAVAQAAAREAVSIILSTHPAELHPDIAALGQTTPAAPQAPVEPQIPA